MVVDGNECLVANPALDEPEHLPDGATCSWRIEIGPEEVNEVVAASGAVRRGSEVRDKGKRFAGLEEELSVA